MPRLLIVIGLVWLAILPFLPSLPHWAIALHLLLGAFSLCYAVAVLVEMLLGLIPPWQRRSTLPRRSLDHAHRPATWFR
jgi:hypothetical protein